MLAATRPASSTAGLAPDEFRARLIAARLSHPLTDHVYSLRAARIKYVPFQFRPLLRLARADEPRLLIADDVGVGKTIEAGLIMKELAARQPLDHVLVLCPKALTVKWREEMRRFDEDFRVLDSASLRYCLNEAHLDGTWPQEYRRAIVHYELFAREAYLNGDPMRKRDKGLRELDPPPSFDLVIADEAHHLRTPGTNSHTLAQYLGHISTALVLLSATPVQTHARDLFTLLNLLRPELFPDRQTFLEVVEPNRHLNTAVRVLRNGAPGAAHEALEALQAAASTNWGRQAIAIDPRYDDVRRRLSADALTRDDRVRCVREIEELNTLAPLVNRTRRRDIGGFTIREPHTVSVPFTPVQRKFYERLLEARRDQLLTRYDPVVVRLILDTLERQASSCLPALARRILTAGEPAVTDLTDAPEVVPDDSSPRLPLPTNPDLVEMARQLPPDDPKLERLLQVVTEARAADGPGKLLVFSFFLGTLDYLAEHLTTAGVRVGVVTGRVDELERQRLRDRFRLDRENPEAIDVLLSSEVGCEGLDYEFCDRLVNYDIPWNPMRIEQRIGRIDRFGQRSPKVLILNFVTPETVEERVFFRCWERLDLFRDTVGDLEGVLGEMTQDLTAVVSSTELTPEQMEERARQLADNAVRLITETRGVEDASQDLLGLDDSLTQDLNALVENGRAVTEQQLEELVRAYLTKPPVSGHLDRLASDVLRLRLSQSARAELLVELNRNEATLGAGRLLQELRRWLSEKDGGLRLTFSDEAASADRSLVFLTATHPLVRLAVQALAPTQGHQLRAHLHAVDPDLPAGRYAFACDTWETIAVRPEFRTVPFVVNAADLEPCPAVERRLFALLADAAPEGEARTADLAEADAGLARYTERRRRDAVSDAHALNEVLLARRIGSLEAHHQRSLQRLDERLTGETESRILTMLTAQRARAIRHFAQRREQLEDRRRVDIVSRRIAEGVLTISHA
ncbi:Helicase conserved C-terminal domain-containing protein [Micromonospora echinaurantiaca]|uniref:Helicase conserved C-terminal domain-containing protein n=1 Tax=Micromonospora echinaurantiaca TaxID=47857 RepID=A0A1C5JS60_9ACTN|nr:Helicase conserved C-terminal domain-containing protein [Micromonospora echinaurantiaca]